MRPLLVLMPYDFRPVLDWGDRSEVAERWEQGLVSGTQPDTAGVLRQWQGRAP